MFDEVDKYVAEDSKGYGSSFIARAISDRIDYSMAEFQN